MRTTKHREKAGPIALVTGANRGLGLEIARQLLARGLRVVLTGRDETATRRALETLGAAGKNALAVRLDVTDPASIAAARRTAEERLGPVDVVVNNAAVLLHENDDPLSISRDAFRATFDTNVFGAIEVCRVFVPSMAERAYGRVVNVSSGVGQFARLSTYAPAYSISKAALNAFTRVLAATYRGHGVLVKRWIRDGSVPTWAASRRPGRSSMARRRPCGSRPCPRMARPEDSSGIAGPFPGDRR